MMSMELSPRLRVIDGSKKGKPARRTARAAAIAALADWLFALYGLPPEAWPPPEERPIPPPRLWVVPPPA